MKTLLNEGIYWNREKGQCYVGANDVVSDCDFTNSGMSDEAKEMIAEVEWPTAGTENDGDDNWFPNNLYELEKSTNMGKNCEINEFCNDTVIRQTKWIGKIGILYGSEYGFASANKDCWNYNLAAGHFDKVAEEDRKWLLDSGLQCVEENYLFHGNPMTLMTPTSYGSVFDKSSSILVVNATGHVGYMSGGAAYGADIYPTLYLKDNIEIVDGNGTEENPFQLSLSSDKKEEIINPQTNSSSIIIGFICLVISITTLLLFHRKNVGYDVINK